MNTDRIEYIVRQYSPRAMVVLTSSMADLQGYKWDLEDLENLHTVMDGHGHVIAYLLEGKDGGIEAAEYTTEPGRRVKAEPWEHTEVRLTRAARFTHRKHLQELQNAALNERRAWAGLDAIYA